MTERERNLLLTREEPRVAKAWAGQQLPNAFSFLVYLPVHDIPLPLYPGLQVQLYDPLVLLQ